MGNPFHHYFFDTSHGRLPIKVQIGNKKLVRSVLNTIKIQNVDLRFLLG